MGNNVRFLEASEVQRLMETPSLKSLTGLRNRCMMGLMYEAGLRTDEVMSLKPRDVVLEEKRVEVLRGKGHKSRTVYFRSDELAMLLERWKRERPRGEYLFPTVRSAEGKGDKIDSRGFRITFKRYVDRAGLDPEVVTPHILRHTCATEMMRRGVNLRVIQEALGHKNIATTQIYTHVVNDDVRRAMSSQQT
jgi:integrase/recombinase XerD